MQRPTWRLAAAALVTTTLAVANQAPAEAADHIDGPAAASEPAADITDYLAWMSPDASSLRLALGVAPFATEDSQFSDAVGYVFHVDSGPAFGDATASTDILCTFAADQRISCWAGDDFVTGDASDPEGLVSEGGTFRVFAGPRNDPFFFEFGGFGAAVAAVVDAAGSLEFDDDGCPQLDAETAGAVVGLLQSNPDGGPARDTFEGGAVLALVVEIDVDAVNEGGPVLATWGATHRVEGGGA